MKSMNKVVKISMSEGCVVEQTLFRSALIKDCVRYVYSRKDKAELVILDAVGDIVNLKDWVVYGSAWESSYSSHAYELG